LFSSDTRDDLTGQSSGNSTGTANNVDVNTDSDDVLSKVSIEGLKTCEGRSSLKLKVLLVHPNGNIVTRTLQTNGQFKYLEILLLVAGLLSQVQRLTTQMRTLNSNYDLPLS
jgi:hypothetical protein